MNLEERFQLLKATEAKFLDTSRTLEKAIPALVENAPDFEDEELQAKMDRFVELSNLFVSEIPNFEQALSSWNRDTPIGLGDAFTAFVFGKKWVTNSSVQDWYGIMPLLAGSLLVSLIAMAFAIPLGVGAAIYVNQVANPLEQNLIKPYIEFISAIPSVVIGFFGIAVFGTMIRNISGWEILSGIDFFPLSERLTAFTAGGLLALMSIPTIFTLAEDALNNVPSSYKEASMAMGSTRLQTILRIIVPTALSGIISAVLLGFGRVIGETMVVLLCAGNRIDIPDFTEGLGVVFEPVHTMTGIIAQELGEVVNGSIH
ncbi:MAG TPA: phosphate ABC transporter permease subunit PstC, partial [Planctomycetaceae bacterium]|nr:phosphate ABC transporter permease subunit PstC [Planctomycetaceae bacterium]